jgi:hypothetical protein
VKTSGRKSIRLTIIVFQSSTRQSGRENIEASIFGICYCDCFIIISSQPDASQSGLIALIESDPYDLSPTQVPILRALVKHAHMPPPISKIVGDALTTFWRNHREHWHTEVCHGHAARSFLPYIYIMLLLSLQRHLISDSDFESELLEECRGKRSYYI